MDPSPPSPVSNSCLTKMKERSALNQVMPFKASGVLRLLQVVQRVALKSSRRACQLFCCPVDAVPSEKPACCPAPDQQPTEPQAPQVALTSPPSTILILNISNSTLIDCVIGNNAYATTVTESRPLMQESALHVHNQMMCSCSHEQQGATRMCPPPVSPTPSSQELQRINIHGSHLNYVIIGDNNYMHAEHLTQTEEPQMCDKTLNTQS